MEWEQYARGELNNFDFTLWKHDLYRPNLRPYDPREIELMKRIFARADDRFQNEIFY